MRRAAQALTPLLAEVRACRSCASELPHSPRPLLQASPEARILIASQAPGRKAHESGVPFDDASGERLRRWLDLDRERFYDPRLVAIVPMGFCYPGKGASGDLPPRAECAPRWRAPLLELLPRVELTLVIGSHAASYHLAGENRSLTEAILHWRRHWPAVVPLPHPSPANNRWFAKNRWFEAELVPMLQARVAEVLRGPRVR